MPGIPLSHGWILHTLGPQDAGEVLGEPAAAVPAELAVLLGPLHIYAVPYIGCAGSRFFAAWQPPAGEDHSSVWLELSDGIHLFLACEGSTAHDTGFELLAAVGELAVPRLDDARFSAYAQLLSHELAEGAQGEIDEELSPPSSRPPWITRRFLWPPLSPNMFMRCGMTSNCGKDPSTSALRGSAAALSCSPSGFRRIQGIVSSQICNHCVTYMSGGRS